MEDISHILEHYYPCKKLNFSMLGGKRMSDNKKTPNDQLHERLKENRAKLWFLMTGSAGL